MLNLRNQTVNVNREALITALYTGLQVHQTQLTELKADYKKAVVKFMSAAARRARKGDFRDLVLRLQAPQDHSQEYIDAIEMLEVSVDENVQLDKETYKAYYRNEWSWSSNLEASSALYKSIIGGKA